MKEPEWMALASEEVGEREVRGRRDNPRIMQFYADVGQGGIKHDEVPWCAAFVGACLERAGIRSTRSLMARSYLKWGVQLDEPRRGTITVLRRGRNPTYGHVGFFGKGNAKIALSAGRQSVRQRKNIALCKIAAAGVSLAGPASWRGGFGDTLGGQFWC